MIRYLLYWVYQCLRNCQSCWLFTQSHINPYPHCHTFMCKHKHEQPEIEKERPVDKWYFFLLKSHLQSIIVFSSLDFVCYYVLWNMIFTFIFSYPARLVLDADNTPIVVPFVHTGMQEVMPIGANFPRIGQAVRNLIALVHFY